MENNFADITHYIQAAVAPVFLIAGVAGLLNVFTGRLIRIMDRLEIIDKEISSHMDLDPNYKIDSSTKRKRDFLLKRLKNINWSIFYATTTGLMVALVILTIFSSQLLGFDTQILISTLFIFSMLCLGISLFLFLREIKYSISYIKVKRNTYI